MDDIVPTLYIQHPDGSYSQASANTVSRVHAWMESQVPENIPEEWEVMLYKPSGGSRVHRGRWVNGELRCWDCPAVWSPSTSTAKSE